MQKTYHAQLLRTSCVLTIRGWISIVLQRHIEIDQGAHVVEYVPKNSGCGIDQCLVRLCDCGEGCAI